MNLDSVKNLAPAPPPFVPLPKVIVEGGTFNRNGFPESIPVIGGVISDIRDFIGDLLEG